MKALHRLILLAMLLLALLNSALGDPQGPDTVTTTTPERRAETPAAQVNAQAGNVTAVTITNIQITEHWQGYYGNVSGKITLDDAFNNTLFDWGISTPKGEVYASNGSSVSWSNVKCMNFSNNGSVETTGHRYNLTKLERFFNINSTEKDGIDETFNQTYVNTTGFTAGPNLITEKCPMLTTFVSDNYQTTAFKEVLLTDNLSIIYTALLEVDHTGFDNIIYDFQMLVNEDGHSAGATNYYFYVEIE